MKKEIVEMLVKTDQIRIRQADFEKIKSMIQSAKINAKIAMSVPLNDDSATLIFREVYESIRQLGDAKWWLVGFEPRNHEVSMDILKEANIKEKVILNRLSRFKRIRNDANYRGFRVSVEQAKEIIDFWNNCAKEIIGEISGISHL